MGAHPVDVFIRNGALVGILVIAIVLFTQKAMDRNVKNGGTENTEKPGGGVVTCWPPAQFSAAQVEYAENFCAHTTLRWAVPDVPTGEMRLLPIKKSHTGKVSEEEEEGEEAGKKKPKPIEEQLLAEAAIVCFTYIVMWGIGSMATSIGNQCTTRLVPANSTGSTSKRLMAVETGDESAEPDNATVTYVKRLLQGHVVVSLYIVAQSIVVGCWIILGVTSPKFEEHVTNATTPHMESTNSSGELFFCDFEIRQLGNSVRQTLQCYESPLEPAPVVAPPSTPPYVHMASVANHALCFSVAMAALTHLLFTFIFGHLSVRREAKMMIAKLKLPESLVSGIRFGFSDFYLGQVFARTR